MHKESKPDNINFKQVGLFQDLAPDELNNVKTLLKEKSFQKGEILFFEGKQCERIFFVRSGRVKIFRTSSSGREQILEILNPGDTCSCHPGQGAWSCSATAEALTPCIVWFFSRDNYAQLIRTNTKLMQSLNKIFARRICHFSSLIEQVSLNDVKNGLLNSCWICSKNIIHPKRIRTFFPSPLPAKKSPRGSEPAARPLPGIFTR